MQLGVQLGVQFSQRRFLNYMKQPVEHRFKESRNFFKVSFLIKCFAHPLLLNTTNR